MSALYSVVAAGLIVTVLAVAYGSGAPMLGVAEFAPTAQESLEAPPTTSGPGLGAGAGGRSRATTTTVAPTTSADDGSTLPGGIPTSLASRSRTCVGDPPRQTADPQSPPCMATVFEGDNGGATATGVTATEIRIAVGAVKPTEPSYYEPLFEYFNRHYELYGRRLVPVFTGEPDTSSPVAARASAVTVANQSVFASLPGYYQPQAAFFHELARNKVISIFPHGGSLLEDRSLYDELHPYVWSVFPSVEAMSRNAADFACTAMAGRTASFAGGGLASATRKFAVIATGPTAPAWTGPIEAGLAACDITPQIARFTDASSSTDRRVALAKFQEAGITSVICICHVNNALNLNNQAASDLGYRPEWVQLTRSSYDEFFANFFSRNSPQLRQIIELSPSEKLLPMQSRPSFAALLEVAPDYLNPAYIHGNAQMLYRELAVLAAGIQAAGPQLTADAFGAGLMGLVFPNTGSGQAPFWQAAVGFGPGDHAFNNDFAVAWWSFAMKPFDTAAPAEAGSWCYFDRGTRFSVGRYPADILERAVNQPVELCR